MKPRRRRPHACAAMSEHPGLLDARAWLVFDAAASELLRCGVLLYPLLHGSLISWSLLFLLAFGCVGGGHLVLLWRYRIGSSVAGRTLVAAGLPSVSPMLDRPSHERFADSEWAVRLSSLIVAMRLMVRDTEHGSRPRYGLGWRLRRVFTWRTRGRKCERSGSGSVGAASLHEVRAGTVHAPAPSVSVSEPRPDALRPAARWPAGSLRRGLPAFMWRLLRIHASTQAASLLEPFEAALPRALPDLSGRGTFIVLGHSGSASVIALGADGSYEIAASEHGIRALAIRGLAVQGGIPLIEDVRLASRIGAVAAPSPMPADCVLSVRLMAQWLREVVAITPQGCL